MAQEDTTFIVNRPAPHIPYYTPAQDPPSGTAKEVEDGRNLPKVFTPLKIRGLEFQNRIFVRLLPMG
jgi:hypothetical protein